MAKSKTKEALEQWLGHLLGLGFVMTVLIGPLSIVVLIIRELTDWPLPWIFKGQWPPGDPFMDKGRFGYITQMDRVEDLRKDLIFTLVGIVLGLYVHPLFWFWLFP